MKTDQAFIELDNVPWTSVNENISMKLLNGLADSGPYTAILKSEPRPPDPHRGQYHAVDEEFYCLGGLFTFDGTHWFRKGSYVHFPPHYVHGARVHVEQGYLLYLRISGTVTTDFVEKPTSSSPYLLEGATSCMEHTVHQRVSLRGRNVNTHGGFGLKSRLLKVHPHTGEGTTLLNWASHTSARRISLVSEKELEIFVLSGKFESEPGKMLQQGSYAFLSGETVEVPLCAESAGRVLVSHGSTLNVDVE
jgi:hypothetical protein